MTTIATLTLNPTLDVAYEVDRVFHTRKMRTNNEHYDPGGGGINVARVFVRLGGNAQCFYLSGGATGTALDGLLDLHQLVRRRIGIRGHTRIASAVLEKESGKEYRFVPPGPSVEPEEWQECLARLGEAQCDCMVLSGSLPPGVPDDFYAQVVKLMAPRGIRIVLDSSGRGLKGGLAEGGVFLIKPSLGELRQLVGADVTGVEEITAAAMDITRSGKSSYVAVTMGHEGAVLAGPDKPVFLPSLDIEAKSAVGAGDSFLSAMVFAVASGWRIEDAFRFGMAAGAAAVLSPGNDLARPDDIRRLFQLVPEIAA